MTGTQVQVRCPSGVLKVLLATWRRNVVTSADVICRHFAKGCVEIDDNWVVMLSLCTVGTVRGIYGCLSLVHPGHSSSLYF